MFKTRTVRLCWNLTRWNPQETHWFNQTLHILLLKIPPQMFLRCSFVVTEFQLVFHVIHVITRFGDKFSRVLPCLISLITSWLTLLFGCCGCFYCLMKCHCQEPTHLGLLLGSCVPSISHILLWSPVLSNLNSAFSDRTKSIVARFSWNPFVFVHRSPFSQETWCALKTNLSSFRIETDNFLDCKDFLVHQTFHVKVWRLERRASCSLFKVLEIMFRIYSRAV